MARGTFFVCMILLFLSAPGCVQRTMKITSEPSGALVYMNDQELGRTPIEREFTWYGTYDVQVRKEGYETLDTKQKVIAPFWQWPPIDLFAELWPGRLKDERHLNYALKPASTQPADPNVMMARSAEIRALMQSSKYTTAPSTHPTSKPAK